MRKLGTFTWIISLVLGLAASAGAVRYEFTPSKADLGDLDHGYYYTWGIDASKIGESEKIAGAKLSFSNISNWDNDAYDLYVHLFNNITNPGGGSKIGTNIYQYSDSNNAFAHDNFLDSSWASQMNITLNHWSAWFEIDSESFAALTAQGVPTRVINALQGLNLREFTTSSSGTPQSNFLSEVKKRLTPTASNGLKSSDFGNYQSKILAAAKHRSGGDADNLIPFVSPDYVEYLLSADQLMTLSNYMADGKFQLGFDSDCHFYNDGMKFTIETTTVPEPGTMVLVSLGLLGIAGMAVRRNRR